MAAVMAAARKVAPSSTTEEFDLDSFERELLEAALERAGGNKTTAARLLGISRRRLYSRLQSLAREPEDPEDPARS